MTSDVPAGGPQQDNEPRDAIADLLHHIGFPVDGCWPLPTESIPVNVNVGFLRRAIAAHARLTAPEPTRAGDDREVELEAWARQFSDLAEWQPMDTAPRDDTLVELVVDYAEGDHALQDALVACTIGFNGFDNHGVDEWKFAGWCWTHDHFVEGKGTPIAWRPSRLNASDDALGRLPPRSALQGAAS